MKIVSVIKKILISSFAIFSRNIGANEFVRDENSRKK